MRFLPIAQKSETKEIRLWGKAAQPYFLDLYAVATDASHEFLGNLRSNCDLVP